VLKKSARASAGYAGTFPTPWLEIALFTAFTPSWLPEVFTAAFMKQSDLPEKAGKNLGPVLRALS
jgi:hypothetical protein